MKILFSSLVVLTSINASAALPKKQLDTQTAKGLELAQEVLSMPEGNRLQIAKTQSEQLYPHLIALSKSPEQAMETRWKALTLAAFVGKDKALKEVEAHLKSPDWFMRNAALISLQSYYPQKAKAAAQSLLKDKALVVRSAAVDVMGNHLDLKSRDLLWEEFGAKYNYRKEQSLWIRGQILSQLAKSPLEKESGLFLKALQEKESSLHSSAIVALEKITQKNLGDAKQKVSEKRNLWLKWAQSNPEITVN